MAEGRERSGAGRACLALGSMLLALPALAASPEPSRERQAVLLHRLKHDCGSCHGMTLKGGLGPSLRPEAIAARSDEELVDVILNGVPGTPMPPWDFEISREEASWLVRRLKDGISDAG